MTAGRPEPCWEPSNRVVNALRACAPIRPEPVSSRTDSGSVPASMRVAATSTSSELLPVPGPPSTRTVPRRPGSSTAWTSGPHWYDIARMTPRGSDKLRRPRYWHDRRVTRLHVHRFGPPGPVRLLALHGLTGHGQRWGHLANRYLPEFAVAAPDLIGHGHSSWEAPWTIDANVAALEDLLGRECDGPVVIVAHSFG